ncbi:hypothetical protein ACERK3_19120 [Phycisphaerales bacterium AB-hyl4]|uniref:Uncharacterized protein n=1 Tax=Natronomicrosphaera hydrolytica TaxID=3242702 RepID=A0ABV4U9V5_9BACT
MDKAKRRTQAFRRLKKPLAVTIATALLLLIVLVTVPLDGEGMVPLKLEMQVGAIEARNTFTRATTSGTSSHARLAASHIVLINTSDHPLMRRVGRRLRDELISLSFVDRVTYIDTEQWSLTDAPRGDLYFVLSLTDHDIRGFVPTGRTLEAEIKLEGGQQPWGAWYHTMRPDAPPLVGFRVRSTLNHHSLTRGLETAAARYTLAINSIAEQLADGLRKELSSLAGKQGLLPALPDAFYGQATPLATDLPLIAADGVPPLGNPGLLLHHDTMWATVVDRPDDAIEAQRALLEAAGWTIVTDDHDRPDVLSFVQATRGNETLNVLTPVMPASGKERSGTRQQLVFHYQQRFSPADVEAAVDTLLVDHAPLSTLLMFSRHMTRAQRERYFEMAANMDTRDPRVLIELGRHHYRQDNTEPAMHALQRVMVMTGLSEHATTQDIQRLGREITGDQNWRIPSFLPADLDAGGFHRLTPGATVETEVGLGEPVLYYVASNSGVQRHAVVVEPSTVPQGVFTLTLRQPHGSSSNTPHEPPRPWTSFSTHHAADLRLLITASELTPERFHVKIEAMAQP